MTTFIVRRLFFARRLFFLMGFLIGFSAEVRVEAAERVQLIAIDLDRERANPLSSALLEEPKNCLTDQNPSHGSCALRVGSHRKYVVKMESREWTLTEKTVVVKLSDDRLRFIEGSIRIRGETTVETEQGEVLVHDEAFLDRQGTQLTIVNTGRESVEFKGRGWDSSHEIPAGLEANIDLPNVKNGRSAVNLPLPFDFDRQVVREARIYDGKKADFPKKLEELNELRTHSAAVAADLHQQVVERKIATVEARRRELKEQRQKREARDRELRELFRRNVLNPE